MASGVSPYTCRNSSYGLRMANKKNKKEIKGFPGYDLHITIGIVMVVGIAIIIRACNN